MEVQVNSKWIINGLTIINMSGTPEVSLTPTPIPTFTPTPSISPTQTPTETITQTPTNSTTPGLSQSPTPTNTPTNTITPTNTVTPTNTITPTNTVTPTNTITPTNTPTNTVTPTNTITPTITPTNTTTPTLTPTQTPQPTQLPPSPADITVAGWYNPSGPFQPASTDGTLITQWDDSSNSQHNLKSTGGNERPVISANTQNGLLSVKYDGNSDYESVTQMDIIAGATGVTIFLVAKYNTTTNNQMITNASNSNCTLGISGTTKRHYVRYAGAVGVDSASTVDTNWHIHTYRFNGSLTGNLNRVIYRRDKSQKTLDFGSTTAGSATTNTNVFYVGSDGVSPGTSNYFDGYLGELIIYGRALSDLEILQTEIYLSTRWAI